MTDVSYWPPILCIGSDSLMCQVDEEALNEDPTAFAEKRTPVYKGAVDE